MVVQDGTEKISVALWQESRHLDLGVALNIHELLPRSTGQHRPAVAAECSIGVVTMEIQEGQKIMVKDVLVGHNNMTDQHSVSVNDVDEIEVCI